MMVVKGQEHTSTEYYWNRSNSLQYNTIHYSFNAEISSWHSRNWITRIRV